MTSLMTRAATLFLCWMMIAQCVDAEEYPEKIQRFLSIFTGNFNNSQQGKAATEFIQSRITLVSVPELNAPVLYMEESINGRAVIILVCEVVDIPGVNAVKLIPYNVTDANRYMAYEFDVTTLVTYNRKDFQDYGCPFIFYQGPSGGNTYDCLWTDCRTFIDGKNPKYNMTVDCSSLNFVTTLGEFDPSTDTTYVLDRMDSSHLQPSPCGNKR